MALFFYILYKTPWENAFDCDWQKIKFNVEFESSGSIRMQGVVRAGGLKPPATRLSFTPKVA